MKKKSICFFYILFYYNTNFSQNYFSCGSSPLNSILCEDFHDNLDNWNGDKYFFNITNSSLNNEKDGGVNSQNRIGVFLSKYYFSNENKNIEWSFDVDINFNPSASNVFDIYLISDKENSLTVENGFFLRIGDNDDYVRFARKRGGSNRFLINFPTKILNNDNNKKLKFLIEYNSLNYFWKISFTINEIEYFEEYFQDNLFIKNGFFGITAKYNSTGSEKFFFSNLLISEHNMINMIPVKDKIILSEILVKHSPSIYLPNSQYIELFNPQKDTINIRNWKIETSNTSSLKIQNDIKILPQSYLIIVWEKNQLNYFPKNINKIYLDGLPQIYNISATRRYIRLLNEQNQIVDHFFYDDITFKDNKKDGGWSLEKIDLYSPCIKNNWGFSEDENGGTPGIENSLTNKTIQENKFFIKELGVLQNSKTLKILFSENINDNFEAKKISNYRLENQKILNIAFSNEIFLDELFIEFEDDLEWGNLYNIEISDNIKNCRGNNLSKNKFNFGITDFPEKNELIINEVLYNPYDNGEKFIEIYNKSDRFLNLNDIKLVSIKNNQFHSEKNLPNNIILPNQHIFLAKNLEGVSSFYSCEENNFLEMKDGIPNISVSQDRIGIITKSKKIIDEMQYNNNMHSENIRTTKGISLERISYENSSLNIKNWTSASFSVKHASPGYENSNSLNNTNNTSNIEIVNKTLVLKNGIPIVPLEVEYNFDETFSSTIKIYNSNGNLIHNLHNNELFPPKGKFFWNGNTINSIKLSSGIYILSIDGYSENGKIYSFKLPFVIGILE